MLYIHWKEENALGIDIIDEQHRGIVSVINSYYHYEKKGYSKDALIHTKGILDDMTALHFQTEEALLKEVGYPLLPSHSALHGTLIKKMNSIFEESLKHDDPHIFLRFLKEWWLHHINEEDKKYASHFKLKG